MNTPRLLWIKAKTRVQQVTAITQALLRHEISRYPAFVERFERRYAATVGRRYGLSFCNGTSALEAALFAAGVGPGDEVIVPSCTFHASIDPVLNAGATPVFADVDEKSLTLCPVDLKRKLSARTKAVVVVHLWGIPADMGAIQGILANPAITLIEDVSHAHGACWGSKACGAWGDFGVFSLQGSKPVAAGEGSMIVTDRREDYLRMSLWGHFDRHGDCFAEIGAEAFRYTGLGYKRRMAPLGALLANVDLNYLEAINRLKRKNVESLDFELGGIAGIDIVRPSQQAVRGGFYQGYPIKLTRPGLSAAAAIEKLKQSGIEASAYPFPLHHQLPVYIDPSFRAAVLAQRPAHPSVEPTPLPVTERLKTQLLLLSPNYLTRLNQRRLSQLIRALETL